MFNAIVKNLIKDGIKIFGADVDKILDFVGDQIKPYERSDVKAFVIRYATRTSIHGKGNFEECMAQFEKAGA